MRVRALVVPLVLVVVMVAGCSTPTSTPESTAAPSLTPTPTVNANELLTAEELLAKSRDTLQEASSFRVKISASIGIITAITDVVYVGDDAKGTQSALGQVTEFVRIGKYIYVKGGESYWSLIVRLEQLQLVTGKWVKVDATNPNHAGVVPSFDASLGDVGEVTRVGPTTIDGKPAITLKSRDGTIHISTDGEPYPLRIEAVQSTPNGNVTVVIDFSEFGTVVATIEVPPGEILDLSTG